MSVYDSQLAEFLRNAAPDAVQSSLAVSRDRTAVDPRCRWDYAKFDFYLLGRYSGSATLHTSHDEELVVWRTFYPNECHGVTKRGVGTAAHVETIIRLTEQEQLHSRYVVISPSANRGRASQLAAMKLNTREHLGDYLRKSVEYANRKGFRFHNPFG